MRLSQEQLQCATTQWIVPLYIVSLGVVAVPCPSTTVNETISWRTAIQWEAAVTICYKHNVYAHTHTHTQVHTHTHTHTQHTFKYFELVFSANVQTI